MSGKLICDSIALKKGGVYPPFKQLKLNFLPIFGLFWASLVFLFTCLVFNMLHYMYNVMQRNGCFPLLVRVSGMFAILPVIVPFLSLPLPSFPSLPFLWASFWCFWSGSWADPGRSGQIRQVPEDPGQVPGQIRPNRQNRTDRTDRTDKIGLYLRLNQLIYLFDTLVSVYMFGAFWGKKKRP